MSKPTAEQLEAAYQAYERYVEELRRFVDAMVSAGVQMKNVEPFANFAEIIVARELGGELQPSTNEGFDVRTDDGVRIQVKSLRVSSSKPKDNGISWCHCTRVKGKKDGPLIDAHRVSVVVYLDFRPYALIDFPVGPGETFPVLGRKGLMFHHVRRFVEGRLPTGGTSVRVVDLRERLPFLDPGIPPAAPAVGE